MYIRYFWQGTHQIYGHIRCIYKVLANFIICKCPFEATSEPRVDEVLEKWHDEQPEKLTQTISCHTSFQND